MKQFVVIQMKIDTEDVSDKDVTVKMSNLVRYAEAESQEEAIGKFVLATQGIKAKKKLDIECYELSNLKRVD